MTVGGAGPGDRPPLDVVIVNWNTGPYLEDCVRAVLAGAGAGPLRVIVVDNASTDGSADAVEAMGSVQLVRNAGNRGFAAACNQGAALGDAPLLLFLNPDVHVGREAIPAAAQFLGARGNERVGIVGVQLRDEAGRVQRSCARFPTFRSMAAALAGLDRIWPRRFPPHYLREWDHADTREVDQVMGAFFLVRRSLFREMGGFDEGFFMYYEDLDFSRRARRAGWKSVFVGDARAVHAGGVSSRQVPSRRLCHVLCSRTRYAAKHFGRAAMAVLLLLTLTVEPPLRMAAALLRRTPGGPLGVLRAYGAFLAAGLGLRSALQDT